LAKRSLAVVPALANNASVASPLGASSAGAHSGFARRRGESLELGVAPSEICFMRKARNLRKFLFRTLLLAVPGLALLLDPPGRLLRAGVGAMRGPGANSPIFADATQEAGIDFRHFNGMTGNYTLAEVMGSGGALFDYNGDGKLDLYLVQGKLLGKNMSEAVFPWRGSAPPTGRLFRNDTVTRSDGSRLVRFTDVTEQSGLAFEGYCMGAAAGDYDNDGRTDLYVTCLGSNHLFHNRGDGTFEDATVKAHADDPRWSTSASFVDYDRDGYLDLYVANYVDFGADPARKCYAASSARDFCGPKAYRPVRDRLFHNRGDGTFEDVTVRSGIASESGAGLGVVAADFNLDGWPDIFVGDDSDPNLLWINQHDGTFRNDALLAGVAVNGAGKAMSSMGVDAGDFNGDGTPDLFDTNIMQDSASLFANVGEGIFEDRAISAGLVSRTRGKTGFGAGWLDFDNDGRLDLVVVNGGVLVQPEQARRGDRLPLRQTKELFRNTGKGMFDAVTERAGPAFAVEEVSRGAIFGDVDNDGDVDVVVTNNNGPARLLLNQIGNRNHWLGLRLLTRLGGRDALGARVEVLRPEGPPLWRRAYTDGSYCSSRDPRVLIGLGSDPAISGIRVIWPTGESETWPSMAVDRYATLREGASPRIE
jgi:enediyne biosynthesis protein E4